jgi:Periplasmic component of the Tol biopolymer transport system
MVSASGGRPEQVTDAASLNTCPVWMPDGRSLLFISNREGSRDVYRVALDRSGRPAQPPARLTTGLNLHGLDLSHDGQVLVYADFSDYANIWSLPIPAGAPVSSAAATPLTTGHQSIEGLALSPDGRWLAFDSDRGGHQAIYRIPLSGGEPQLLSADSGDDFMPAWSPDGRELAYYGFRDGRRRLFVMPLDGGSPGAIVRDSGNQRYPGWSPDGRHLVFHSDRTGRFELYVAERDTVGRWSPPRSSPPTAARTRAGRPTAAPSCSAEHRVVDHRGRRRRPAAAGGRERLGWPARAAARAVGTRRPHGLLQGAGQHRRHQPLGHCPRRRRSRASCASTTRQPFPRDASSTRASSVRAGASSGR